MLSKGVLSARLFNLI
ncbi:hypothetical protein MLK57_16715 [Escherichia coli]|nr:hypothetical protein [Escherichia coli]